MIKCGKLKGKDGKTVAQCILYSKDGSKPLGYFPYSRHGGEKGAKKAAEKRERAVQYFKQKHHELVGAIGVWGAPNVLKYLLEKTANCEACQEVVASYVEKARGEGQGAGGPRQGDGGADQCVCPECGAKAPHEKGTPCKGMKCPKCGVAMIGKAEKSVEKAVGFPSGGPGKPPTGYNVPKNWTPASAKKYWESVGGSVSACMKKLGGEKAARFCASLKDYVKGTTKWRGKKEKSFEEVAEEALMYLQKDDDELDALLEDVDLGELEAWLESQEGLEPEPEPEPAHEPEPAQAEPAPAEPAPEEPPNFVDFLRGVHRDKVERVRAMMAGAGEEVSDAG